MEGEMAEEEVKSSNTQGLGPFVSIVLILNLVATGAIAFYQFKLIKEFRSMPSVSELIKQESQPISDEAKKEMQPVKTVDEGLLMPLEGFTVNLAQGDGPRRFVKLNTVLKFSKDSKKEEFEARKPQIKDTIISLLNSKRAEDLLKKEGKAYLKEEIKSAINSFLVDGQVIDVYYIGFQIN